MYTRKLYEPENELRIVIPGYGIGTAAGGSANREAWARPTQTRMVIQEKEPKQRLLNDPYWKPADTSAEEKIQRRRKNGSGQLSPSSIYRPKEKVIDEDIPNLYRTDPIDVEHRVKLYVQEYASWYNSSLQEIGALNWDNRNRKNSSLDMGAAAFSEKGEELKKYLVANRDQIDQKYYDEVSTLLHDQEGLSGDLIELDKAKRDVFSQFESQSSYDEFLAEWERKDRILRTPGEDPNFDELSKGSIWNMTREKGDEASDVYYLINGGFGLDPFNKVSAQAFPLYESLNEDEIRMFNYYYNTGNYQTAMEYLKLLQDPLARRAAEAEFRKYEGKTGKEILYGVAAGLDQFASGVRGAKDALLGTENEYPTTKTEYLSGFVREDLGDNGPKLPEWMGGASLGQAAYDAAQATGQMLPSVLTAGGVGLISPGAGKAVGNAMVFTSSGGNAYIEARRMGYDEKQARFYASLVGGSEAGLGYLLGGISKLGGKAVEKLTGKVLPGVDKAIAKLALNYGGKIVAEGNEEFIQAVLEPVFQKIALNIDADIDFGEAVYSWLLGAMSAAGFGGVDAAVDFGKMYDIKVPKMMGNVPANGVRTSTEQTVSSQGKAPVLMTESRAGVSQPRETPQTMPNSPRSGADQPQSEGQIPYLTTDHWTGELEGLWTETDARTADTGRGHDADTRAEDTQKPLRYEDALREYLNGRERTTSAPDNALSANTDAALTGKPDAALTADRNTAPAISQNPSTEPNITEETTSKPKAQVIGELAPKIAKPGITSGKATIEAQRLYAEVEKRYGQAAERILESFQPGQEPNKFLDGIQNAYFAGKLGSGTALKNSGAAAYLTDHQRAAAFELGERSNRGEDHGSREMGFGAEEAYPGKHPNEEKLVKGENVDTILSEDMRISMEKLQGMTLQEQAKELDRLLYKYTAKESRWKGEITEVGDDVLPRARGRKLWGCSILVRYDADIKTKIHELLHARSVSHTSELAYTRWQYAEEAAVELFAREICDRNGIGYKPAYSQQVKQLTIAKSILFPDMSTYDFAKTFFEQGLLDRYGWLRKEADLLIARNILSPKNVVSLNRAVDTFRRILK